MKEQSMARVAILADTSLQRGALQQALTSNGYQVVLNSSPSRLDEETLADSSVDLWLVDLALAEDSPLIDALLQQADAPVLYGEGQAPERHSEQYPIWEKRLFGKLKKLIGDASQAVAPSLEVLVNEGHRPERLPLPVELAAMPLQAGEPANEVWLLAGSLGGPQAVKTFLDALPGGLPVGFIYAQHMQPGHEAELAEAIARHSQWPVKQASDGEPIRCGEVTIVPVAQGMYFHDDGRIRLSAAGWQDPYNPSIDQTVLNLVQHFGGKTGVILFSGTGCDGSASLPYARRKDAQIWAQRGETCLCPALPDSARATGQVAFSGEPRELAEAFMAHLVDRFGKQEAS
ncbi:chemotaxis protein CheB [Pseudomonas matsuisoli]|uniref:protein-glutamate methylesterase n=1 Tax=Pseudomonas matsuisoli TaxID=1515666 RepID=A0A917Q004_9PSED|nr:chemotaxis protein CheB [Pseudomonas matsuisoli]GGK02888.1 protein-glutamate methylesterase [Pseudomonas matsuisoli]